MTQCPNMSLSHGQTIEHKVEKQLKGDVYSGAACPLDLQGDRLVCKMTGTVLLSDVSREDVLPEISNGDELNLDGHVYDKCKHMDDATFYEYLIKDENKQSFELIDCAVLCPLLQDKRVSETVRYLIYQNMNKSWMGHLDYTDVFCHTGKTNVYKALTCAIDHYWSKKKLVAKQSPTYTYCPLHRLFTKLINIFKIVCPNNGNTHKSKRKPKKQHQRPSDYRRYARWWYRQHILNGKRGHNGRKQTLC